MPYLPYPPDKGTALRNLYILRGAAQTHTVHLLTFCRERDRGSIENLRQGLAWIEAALPPAERSQRARLAALASPTPDLAARLESADFMLRLRKILTAGSFDLVQVEGLEMAPYALEVCRQRGNTKRPLVLFDDHNAEYALQRTAFRTDLRAPGRWPRAAYSLIQWQKLRRYEREVCRRADAVLAVSEADASALRALEPAVKPLVIPNGVDTGSFSYIAPGTRRNKGEETALIFTGTMDYRPNVDAAIWFCRKILPLIKRRYPSAHVFLVGRDPAPAVEALAGPDVTVTGRVKDVQDYLRRSTIFVAPLRMGSGTRLKVLEAMSCGLPVVTTGLGIEGIAAMPGQEVLVADHPREFAAKVMELLDSPSRAQELATRARLLVEHKYDWKAILPDLEGMYRSM